MGILDDLLGLSGPNKPVLPGLLDKQGYLDPAAYDQARRGDQWSNFFAGLARGGAPSTSPRNFGSALTTGLEGFNTGGEGFDQSQLRAAQAAQARAGVQKSAFEISSKKDVLDIYKDYLKKFGMPAGAEGAGTGTAGEGSGSSGGADFPGAGTDAATPSDGGVYWTPAGLAALRPTEGRYDQIHYPSGTPSTASGAYGFLDSTWREQAAKAGVDVTKWPRAYMAPPAVQDMVAAQTPIHHWTGVDANGKPFNAAAQKLATNPDFVARASAPAATAGEGTSGPPPIPAAALGASAGPPPIPDLPGAPAGAAMPPPAPGLLAALPALTPTPTVPPGTPFDAESSPENRLTVGRLPPTMRPEAARQAQTALVNAYADALQKGFKGTMQDFAAQATAERGGASGGGPPIAPTTAGTDTITVPPPAPAPGLFGTVGGGDTDLGGTKIPSALPGAVAPGVPGAMPTPPPAPTAPPPPALSPTQPLPLAPAPPGVRPLVQPQGGAISPEIAAASARALAMSGMLRAVGIDVPPAIDALAGVSVAGLTEAAKRRATQPFDVQMEQLKGDIQLSLARYNAMTDQQKAEQAAKNQMTTDQYRITVLQPLADFAKAKYEAELKGPTAGAEAQARADVARAMEPGTEAEKVRQAEEARARVAMANQPGIKFQEEVMTGLGKQIIEQRTAALGAVKTLQTLDDTKHLLQGTGIFSGPLANEKLAVARVAQSLGWPNEKIANTQTYLIQAGQAAVEILASKAFGSGTGISENDRKAAERLAGGDLTLDLATIKRIIDISERRGYRAIETFNNQIERNPDKDRLYVSPPDRFVDYTESGKRIYSKPDGRQVVKDY